MQKNDIFIIIIQGFRLHTILGTETLKPKYKKRYQISNHPQNKKRLHQRLLTDF